MSVLAGDEVEQELRRQFRIVAILDGASVAGMTPISVAQLHSVAYFADALAPVWGLRILDALVLKHLSGPRSSALQRDVDRLVGRGVLLARDVHYEAIPNAGWQLHAQYELNEQLARPVITQGWELPAFAEQLEFVREVVFAVSALGDFVAASIGQADAAYGDPFVDDEGMLDMGDGIRLNQASRVARRFAEVMEPRVDLSSAEQIHLYIRALYRRMSNAA